MSVIQFVYKLKLLPCFRKKENVPICEALPHPVPSLEKKGLCVYGEGSVNRVHKYTSVRGREAWGAGVCPPLPRAGGRIGRRVAGTGAPGRRGPGRRGGRGCCAAGDRRAEPGRTDLGGTLRAHKPPFVLRLRGRGAPPLPPAVAPCHRPIPCLLYPHLLQCSRCAARPPRSRPRSAGPPDSPRPPAPGFPGRRLGKVEEEAAQERRRPPRDSRRHIPPQPPDQ